MAWPTLSLPDGWPVSLWFFIITAVVFLLQLFPLTGVFLMILAAALWSVVLINLGMVGIVIEVATLRVNPMWLIIPLLYAGSYYWAYSRDQANVAKVRADAVRFNDGKSLAFDPASQDLLFEDSKDGLGLYPSGFIENFGLSRVFDSHGRVFMVGTKESCDLIRENHLLFMSAGIQSHAITRQGERRFQKIPTGFCRILMKGEPDRPLVRVQEKVLKPAYGRLPVTLREISASDERSGASAIVRVGKAEPLKRIPMPGMGCALNSGAAKWQCFAGFMRDSVQVLPDMARYEGGTSLLAKVLGLRKTDDLGRHAVGVERFKPMADAADAELTAKEVALLEQILADPLAPIKNSYFRHLPQKPDIIAPYAGRLIAALRGLQSADHRGAANGRDLWTLVAALPNDALEPHRSVMVAMMQPGAVKRWTEEEGRIWDRLDASRFDERELLLARIESHRYSSGLVKSFCRMGASTPDDAKRRLLAKWHELGRTMNRKERPMEHIPLYLALARMGLKADAGQVEQRYHGSDWRGIWAEVTPQTPADICELSYHELSQRFRNYRG